MPKISVISIAKKEDELEDLRRALANQTFRDFELITSTKGTIPEAWNDAISRAKGEFLVFIESDATPLNNQWLEEIVKIAKKNTLCKGLEINPTDLDLCNLVCDASIFKRVRFDEDFQIGEDTELFARVRKMGIKIEHTKAFPVVHNPGQTWRKTLSRGLKKGMFFMKIIYLHGRDNIDDVNTRNFRGNYINPISNRVRIITENVLVLLGLFIGAIRYLPIVIKRKLYHQNRC
jgi:glycosyltransferase involved in cell wall biosynthesis